MLRVLSTASDHWSTALPLTIRVLRTASSLKADYSFRAGSQICATAGIAPRPRKSSTPEDLVNASYVTLKADRDMQGKGMKKHMGQTLNAEPRV